MLKQIIKIIWKQRLNNGWIFCELLLVVCALIWISDVLLVDRIVYNRPLGFNIENTYRLKFNILTPEASEYISPEVSGSTIGNDLVTLLDNIRAHPEVEEIAISHFARPYMNMSQNITLKLPEGHSAPTDERTYLYTHVSKEFFDVFRIKNKDGQLLGPLLDEKDTYYLFTKELEVNYFDKGEVGKDRNIIFSDEYQAPLTDVTESLRYNEYGNFSNVLYRVLGKSNQINYFNIASGGENYRDITIRMKKHKSESEMYDFLKDLGDRYKINNVYISSFQSFDKIRAKEIRKDIGAAKKNVAILVFLLINILFGVIGTFWLKTQYRKNEIGLRIALGSTRQRIFSYLFIEGLVLLIFTIPFILIYLFNLVAFDMYNVAKVSLTWWRILAAVGIAYSLLVIMICLGIWLPARKSMKVAPAEALHYE